MKVDFTLPSPGAKFVEIKPRISSVSHLSGVKVQNNEVFSLYLSSDGIVFEKYSTALASISYNEFVPQTTIDFDITPFQILDQEEIIFGLANVTSSLVGFSIWILNLHEAYLYLFSSTAKILAIDKAPNDHLHELLYENGVF